MIGSIPPGTFAATPFVRIIGESWNVSFHAAKAMFKRLSKRGLIVLERGKKDALEYGCIGPEHLVKKAQRQK